ncbi:sugar ABC transporter permease [Xylanibacillus composti]|uniref:Putative ABC transporter permease protein AmyD n=1 Tax=Xylanibacillus composti TaxID=1572762 RepID=A0A8J4H5B1_9BACL|nr:sugar ABC transporter permease [Xylanibacillus composti]MDT9726545.1 sugar ABC transporter permease [Xylanibacillus composti]GIQ68963.1 putative ABC transporter permease protein AmyD [Xylanibacillus composti]
MYPFGKGLSRHMPFLLLMIPVALYVLLAVGPSLVTIVFSFTNATGIPGTSWQFIGLDNYKTFFTASNAGDQVRAIGRSLYFAFAVVLIQNAVALLIAIIVNKRLRGDVFYRATYFLPVVLGVTVSGLIWQMMFNPMGGPAQKLLNVFGTQSNFFGSYDIAFELIIFVQIWMYMGYSMTIFLAGLQAIPKDLYEAGYMDGARGWSSFRHITFPMIAPAMTVNILLSIIGALQTFDIIYVLTGGNFETSTLAYNVFAAAFATTTSDFGRASAIAMIQFVFVFAFAIVAMLYFRKREVEL